MNHPLPRLRSLSSLVLLSLGLAGPSPAQDAQVPYTELVEVRVVNVEVVVEGAKGKRVRGLAADGFRLEVDGREVPIEHFVEVRGGSAVVAGIAPVANRPVDEPAEPPAVRAGQPVAHSYLIFIDDYFAIGAHRNLVLDRLASQLGKVRPPDQVAVVAFGGRDLELLSPWSSSRVDLDRALAAAAARPAWGLMRFSERQRLGIPQVGGGSFGDFFPGLNEFELRREAAALVAAMQRFADAPGRKILIVLSGGWPSIDTSVTSRYTERSDELQENDLDILRPVIETANLLGFTVYPIDLPGYRDSSQVIVARSGEFDTSWRQTAGNRSEDPNIALPNTATPQTFVYGQRNDGFFANDRLAGAPFELQREMLRQSTLRVVARDTGGRALLGGARLRPLATVVDDTDSYYWLSFTPAPVDEERRHRIRVSVDGDDYRVRARRSYHDRSTSSQVTMVTLGAARIGDPPLDELGLELGTARRVGYRKIEVPLRVIVPLDQVEFLPADGGFVANLELRIAAVDALDRHTEVPIVPIRLVRQALPGAGETASFETTAALHSRARTLALSLFDPVADKVLLASSALTR